MDRSRYDKDVAGHLSAIADMHEFEISMLKLQHQPPISSEEFDEIQRKIEAMAYECDVQVHASDPLDTSLQVNIQPFTMQRLERVVKERGEDINQLVNSIISLWLYDVGE